MYQTAGGGRSTDKYCYDSGRNAVPPIRLFKFIPDKHMLNRQCLFISVTVHYTITLSSPFGSIPFMENV